MRPHELPCGLTAYVIDSTVKIVAQLSQNHDSANGSINKALSNPRFAAESGRKLHTKKGAVWPPRPALQSGRHAQRNSSGTARVLAPPLIIVAARPGACDSKCSAKKRAVAIFV